MNLRNGLIKAIPPIIRRKYAVLFLTKAGEVRHISFWIGGNYDISF